MKSFQIIFKTRKTIKMFIGRFLIVPIFFETNNGVVSEIPLDLNYISAICDNKEIAESLLAKIETKRDKWIGPILRHEIVGVDCVESDLDKSIDLPTHIFYKSDSCFEGTTPYFNIYDDGEVDTIKIRKNVYYYEGIVNTGIYLRL